MTNIRAPYNFVPINKDVYEPKWWRLISHDIPFKEGESGTIHITIENKSPLFLRNSESEYQEYSAHIPVDQSTKQYFIPATSIKGMVSSVLEILSFGMFDRYNDDYFAYRIFHTKESDSKEYFNAMKLVRCGWLRKDGEGLFLSPCNGDYEKISHDDIKKQFNRFDKRKQTNEKQFSLAQGKPLYPRLDDFNVVCTGNINRKEIEYLFPIERLPEIKLNDEVKKAFITTHKPTPLFEKYYLPKLKKGEEIPVFFLQLDNGEVHSLGLSRMYRYPYKNSVASGVYQIGNVQVDLCNAIFGYSKNSDSLKGRVHIGNAFANRPINDDELIDEKKGVLGQPKASYYPLYLKHNQEKYSTYDSKKIELAGRKRYRIRPDNKVVDPPTGNDNEKVLTHFKPLPSNENFTLKITVHNLLPIEIGGLLSALTFHNHSNVSHNIGLAKSYGYGKIQCKVVSLSGFKYNFDDYLRIFEEEMSTFTYSRQKTLWKDTEQVKQLFAIASDHTNEDEMKIMELDEYKEFKRNKSPLPRLKEKVVQVNSLVDKGAILGQIKMKEFDNELSIARTHEKNEDFEKAITCYLDVKKRLNLKGIETNEIDNKVIELEGLVKKRFEKLQKQKALEEQERKKQKAQTGPDISRSKDFKGIKNRMDAWLKQTNNDKLPDEFVDSVYNQIIEAYSKFKPSDCKEWKGFEKNKVWIKISEWIGEDRSRELYKKLITIIN